MNKLAARHAWESLHKARNAHAQLMNAKTVEEAEDAWSEFLSASSRIYSKLHSGSKGHKTAQPWFGRMKNERRSDELLAYVHQARNADEHGISQISVRKLEGLQMRGTEAGARLYGLQVQNNGEVIHHPSNTGIHVETLVSMTLADIYDDKHGDTFPVPTTHLGKPLPDQKATTISTLALEYLNGLVRDGSKFAQ
ncbi:MAG: hypothetical protein H7228_01470 [Polaromonas sp.]|nr:hypothetical protein [Polaromonas sp.]